MGTWGLLTRRVPPPSSTCPSTVKAHGRPSQLPMHCSLGDFFQPITDSVYYSVADSSYTWIFSTVLLCSRPGIPLPTVYPFILGMSRMKHSLSYSQTCISQPRELYSRWVPAGSWARSVMSPPYPPRPLQVQSITRLCKSSPLPISTAPFAPRAVQWPLPRSVHNCTGASCYSPHCLSGEVFQNSQVFSCHPFHPKTPQWLPPALRTKSKLVHTVHLSAQPPPQLCGSPGVHRPLRHPAMPASSPRPHM